MGWTQKICQNHAIPDEALTIPPQTTTQFWTFLHNIKPLLFVTSKFPAAVSAVAPAAAVAAALPVDL